jgi:hypothetical protein
VLYTGCQLPLRMAWLRRRSPDIAQYIPQTLLLPHCDAIIFQGGYNALLAALWHGLSMVITPLGRGDQYLNSESRENVLDMDACRSDYG